MLQLLQRRMSYAEPPRTRENYTLNSPGLPASRPEKLRSGKTQRLIALNSFQILMLFEFVICLSKLGPDTNRNDIFTRTFPPANSVRWPVINGRDISRMVQSTCHNDSLIIRKVKQNVWRGCRPTT